MSERGQAALERHKAEQKARQAAAAEPAPEPSAPERQPRDYGKGAIRNVRDSNPPTGLSDPRLATWLYVAVVGTAVMFSATWGALITAIQSGTKK